MDIRIVKLNVSNKFINIALDSTHVYIVGIETWWHERWVWTTRIIWFFWKNYCQNNSYNNKEYKNDSNNDISFFLAWAWLL